MRIVVVGGVAGGMSFAARARRLAEDAEINVLERGGHVSFANCGLPYHVAGEIPERSDLLLHTPDALAASLNLDVRVGHEVVGIDPVAHRVSVRDEAGGRAFALDYDALVLATGAVAARPPIPGLDLPQVRTHPIEKRSRRLPYAARNPRMTVAVVYAVADYTVAVGPLRPGRQDRIVAIIGETKDSSVFRWAGDEQTVLRIAAEVGVGPDQIQWHPGPVDD